MSIKYESLKKVLSTINDKKDLSKDNIVEELKTELKKQGKGLYQEWEKDEFDVNHRFILHYFQTLLIMATQNSHANIVKVLLEKGAHVNEIDLSGMTALHLATASGHEKIVEDLIKAKANVNAVDRDGRTPLDFAECCAKHYGQSDEDRAKIQDVVEALLEAGGGSFLKARNKAMIAGGVTTLLGNAIAVALFTTGIIAAQLIPIVISVVAIAAAALVVGCATYELLKPSTKVDGAEKPSAILTKNEQQEAAV